MDELGGRGPAQRRAVGSESFSAAYASQPSQLLNKLPHGVEVLRAQEGPLLKSSHSSARSASGADHLRRQTHPKNKEDSIVVNVYAQAPRSQPAETESVGGARMTKLSSLPAEAGHCAGSMTEHAVQSNEPFGRIELPPGERIPSIFHQATSTSMSLSQLVEPSISLDSMPRHSSLAGITGVQSSVNGLRTPHTTPRTSSCFEYGAPSNEEPSTPRDKETPGRYTEVIRMLEKAFISTAEKGGEGYKPSDESLATLSPRRRGLLGSLLQPGSQASTPRSHAENKRVSKLLRQNKPSILRHFLCPRVQTGSATGCLEAGIDASFNNSFKAWSSKHYVAASGDGDFAANTHTEKLQHKQVERTTVVHECAAFDLSSTPRDSPGDMGITSQFVLAWTAQTGYFLREILPGTENGPDQQALKILQEQEISALPDSVQIVPVRPEVNVDKNIEITENLSQENKMMSSRFPQHSEGNNNNGLEEAWRTSPGTSCCSPPCIGSVAGSYDVSSVELSGGDKQLEKNQERKEPEPDKPVTIGDWIVEAVAQDAFLAVGQHVNQQSAMPEPEQNLSEGSQEVSERRLTELNSIESPSALIELAKDDSTYCEMSSLDESLLAREDNKDPLELNAEGGAREATAANSCDNNSGFTQIGPAKPCSVSSPTRTAAVPASPSHSDCTQEQDWYAADREAVEALITATDKMALAAMSSAGLPSPTPGSPVQQKSRQSYDGQKFRRSCESQKLRQSQDRQKVRQSYDSQSSSTAPIVVYDMSEGKPVSGKSKKGSTKSKGAKKAATQTASKRPAKRNAYAKKQGKPPKQNHQANSFGAWSANSSLNTSAGYMVPGGKGSRYKFTPRPVTISPSKTSPEKTNQKKSPAKTSGNVSAREHLRGGTAAQRGYLSMLRASSPRHYASMYTPTMLCGLDPHSQSPGFVGAPELEFSPADLPDGLPMDPSTVMRSLHLTQSLQRKRGRTQSRETSPATSLDIRGSPKQRFAGKEDRPKRTDSLAGMHGRESHLPLVSSCKTNPDSGVDLLGILNSSSSMAKEENSTGPEQLALPTAEGSSGLRQAAATDQQKIPNLMDADMWIPNTPANSPELVPVPVQQSSVAPVLPVGPFQNDLSAIDVMDGLEVEGQAAVPSSPLSHDGDKAKLVARWWLKRSTSRAKSSNGLGLMPKSLHCPSPLRDCRNDDLNLINLNDLQDNNAETWLSSAAGTNGVQNTPGRASPEEESFELISPISFSSEDDSVYF